MFGFDTGVIAGAMLFIVPDFHLGPAQQGLVVSAVTFGALFGALVGGTSSDTIGRRWTNIAAGLSFVAGSVFSAIAPNVDVLIASRVLIGLAIGLTSVAAPMYIAELSPARNRGKLVSLFQLAITIGILVSYIVDRALAPEHAWRWMLGLAFIPGALLVLGMIAMPESPRWLLKTGAEKAARQALALVRSPDEIDAEVQEIREDLEHNRPAAWSELLMPGLRPALLVGVGLAVFQQVTGINTIIYYAPQIFQRAGLDSATTALAATAGIGVVNVLSTLIAIWLVDRVGRKPLLLAGLTGMTLSLAALGVAQRFASTIGIDPQTARANYRRIHWTVHRLLRLLAGACRMADDLGNLSQPSAGPSCRNLDGRQLDGKLSGQPFVPGSTGDDGTIALVPLCRDGCGSLHIRSRLRSRNQRKIARGHLASVADRKPIGTAVSQQAIPWRNPA